MVPKMSTGGPVSLEAAIVLKEQAGFPQEPTSETQYSLWYVYRESDGAFEGCLPSIVWFYPTDGEHDERYRYIAAPDQLTALMWLESKGYHWSRRGWTGTWSGIYQELDGLWWKAGVHEDISDPNGLILAICQHMKEQKA